jgi:hypothetical protein
VGGRAPVTGAECGCTEEKGRRGVRLWVGNGWIRVRMLYLYVFLLGWAYVARWAATNEGFLEF